MGGPEAIPLPRPHRELQDDLARHLRDAGWLTYTEIQIGPSGRVDVVAVKPHTYARKDLRAYEVKASRQDFLRDLDAQKFRLYLAHFHRLYFAAPAGVIRIEELPKTVGLITKGPAGWTHVRAGRGNEPPALGVDTILALLYRGFEEHGYARDLRERLLWKDGVPYAAKRLGQRRINHLLRVDAPPAAAPLSEELDELRRLLEDAIGAELRSPQDVRHQERAIRRLLEASVAWQSTSGVLQKIAHFVSTLGSPYALDDGGRLATDLENKLKEYSR